MTPRRRILPVFIPHMGCPHACVFCNQHKITAAPGSTVPVEPLEELDRLLNLPLDGTERELAFYGGSFTAIPLSQQLAFLEPAAKALADGRISSIRLSTRPDAVDSETLARLSAYGVSTVELGAQSMRDEVLVQSGRGVTTANSALVFTTDGKNPAVKNGQITSGEWVASEYLLDEGLGGYGLDRR